MADPPWDIHMSVSLSNVVQKFMRSHAFEKLPYGTMTDDEMRAMPIPTLQDEGLLFLWVTGRAMEVGRECMRVWGYTRVDEVIWVKINQVENISILLYRIRLLNPPVAAPARYTHGSNRPLDKPYERAHACWSQDPVGL
jgi:hypothetical protein